MGFAVSSAHVDSAAPSSSHSALAPAWALPTGDSPPRTAPVWVLPMGCSPSGTGCSSVGPPRGHKPCQQTCSTVGSSLHEATGPARSLLQCGLPTGSHPPAPAWGHPWAAGRDLLHREPPWAAGHSLPHQGLLHGLQGNLCPDAWSTSTPSFCTDLGVCRAVSLTSSHFSLLLEKCTYRGFSRFLNDVIPEVLPPSLVGSALASSGSVLELAGFGSIGHGGSCWHLLTESTPAAPPLAKTWPRKPSMARNCS